MAPLPIARVVIFILIIAFITGLAFYALTVGTPPGERPERPCPKDRPVRVEDGSCMPASFFETTAHRDGVER